MVFAVKAIRAIEVQMLYNRTAVNQMNLQIHEFISNKVCNKF